MNSYRKTLVLAALFLTGLLVLWGLERAGVPTESQRRERAGRVLPQLLEVREADIGQVEIARGDQLLRFERRGPDAWQMTRPKNVAADAVMLETIVRNLKGLRPSPDAGKIGVPAREVGLDPPRVVVRLWTGLASPSWADASPLASLELGKILRLMITAAGRPSRVMTARSWWRSTRSTTSLR